MSESRAVLLQAAAEEFAQHGLKGARIQAIVKRAGVNERMIYHHFGSKDGLYLAVVDDQRNGVGERWLPALHRAADQPPHEGMRTALAGLMDVFRERPLLLALLMHEWLSGSAVASFPTADMLPVQLRELYLRGQQDGTFRPEVAFEVAYGVAVGSIVSLAVFSGRFAASTGQAEISWEHSRDLVIDQLVDGMTGPNR